MASTYVKVTSLEDALKYFDAGLLHWYSEVQGEWLPQSVLSNAYPYPPTDREVAAGWWSILVEEEEECPWDARELGCDERFVKIAGESKTS